MDFDNAFSRNVCCILGLPFDAVSMPEATRQVSRSTGARSKLFLSTPNLNWLRVADKDPAFREATLLSDLSIADGMPVVWISRMLALPIRQRTSGSDLMNELARSTPLKVFFFGGEGDSAITAAGNLNGGNGPMTAVGGFNPGHGTFEQMSRPEIIETINGSAPDFVVVSLGAVKGQKWIAANKAKLTAPIVSHLGAVVNFYAGTVKRAPGMFQRLGIEWLWRILQEPRLASRYFEDALFLLSQLLLRVLPYKLFLLRNRNVAGRGKGSLSTITIRGSFTIFLSGAFGAHNIDAVKAAFLNALNSGADVTIDMHRCTYIDAMFIGILLLLRKYCMENGRHVSIDGVQAAARNVFYYCHAEYLLAPPEERIADMPLQHTGHAVAP